MLGSQPKRNLKFDGSLIPVLIECKFKMLQQTSEQSVCDCRDNYLRCVAFRRVSLVAIADDVASRLKETWHWALNASADRAPEPENTSPLLDIYKHPYSQWMWVSASKCVTQLHINYHKATCGATWINRHGVINLRIYTNLHYKRENYSIYDLWFIAISLGTV